MAVLTMGTWTGPEIMAQLAERRVTGRRAAARL